MRYPNDMDHVDALFKKIARLRSEVAEIKLLNERYRLEKSDELAEAAADVERHQRLQEIQRELVQISRLGNKTILMARRIERHPRRYPVKRAA